MKNLLLIISLTIVLTSCGTSESDKNYQLDTLINVMNNKVIPLNDSADAHVHNAHMYRTSGDELDADYESKLALQFDKQADSIVSAYHIKQITKKLEKQK